MKNRFFFAALVLLFASSCANNENNETTVTPEKENAVDSNAASANVSIPSFSVQDINGNAVNLQDLKGKKLFVNLWASWCPPCKREMPSIEKLYHSVDTAKVAFIMLSLDDNFDKAKAYMKHQKLNLPLYYPTENLPALFNVQGIPATFIFNEKGDLLNRIEGATDYDTDQFRKMLQ
jgi:thiol-disulfide isomerase/thioredoxin